MEDNSIKLTLTDSQKLFDIQKLAAKTLEQGTIKFCDVLPIITAKNKKSVKKAIRKAIINNNGK